MPICSQHDIGYVSKCPTCAFEESESNMYWTKIEGAVKSSKNDDEWLDDFIDWLESRGESFAGVTAKEFNPEEDEDDLS